MIRLMLVELRRAFRRRATRVTGLVILVAAVLVMIIGLIKIGDVPPVRYVHQSDGIVHLTGRGFTETVQVLGNRAHFTRQLNPNSPNAPRLRKIPPETNTEVLRPGEAVGIEGKPGHQSAFTGFPNPSLARFSDLYQRGADNSTITPPAILGIFLALLLGATLAGADWKWNTYGVLLTWVPQRVRLISARLFSCFVVGATGLVVLAITYAMFTIPIVLAHGSFAGMTSSWWAHILELLLRIAILGGLTAVGGACVAIITRNTIGALVISMVYLILLEHLILALIPRWWPLAFGRYLPILYDWRGDTVTPKVFVHIGGAVFTTIVWMALLVTAAIVSFSKRDVAVS